jgi:hypothetical protein
MDAVAKLSLGANVRANALPSFKMYARRLPAGQTATPTPKAAQAKPGADFVVGAPKCGSYDINCVYTCGLGTGQSART